MNVICKGHKICPSRIYCMHSKSHDYNDNGNNYYLSCTNSLSENNHDSNCICSHIFLREEKLKKLQR